MHGVVARVDRVAGDGGEDEAGVVPLDPVAEDPNQGWGIGLTVFGVGSSSAAAPTGPRAFRDRRNSPDGRVTQITCCLYYPDLSGSI